MRARSAKRKSDEVAFSDAILARYALYIIQKLYNCHRLHDHRHNVNGCDDSAQIHTHSHALSFKVRV